MYNCNCSLPLFNASLQTQLPILGKEKKNVMKYCRVTHYDLKNNRVSTDGGRLLLMFFFNITYGTIMIKMLPNFVSSREARWLQG